MDADVMRHLNVPAIPTLASRALWVTAFALHTGQLVLWLANMLRAIPAMLEAASGPVTGEVQSLMSSSEHRDLFQVRSWCGDAGTLTMTATEIHAYSM